MKKGGKGGFTLIELVLVIAISGIIFISLAQAVIIVMRSWDIALAGTNLIGQTEVAVSRMARDIMQVKNKTNLITAQSNNIRFNDVYGYLVEYKLVGDQLLRVSRAAVDNVTALSFEYFDKNGNAIASPIIYPFATDVRTVRMTITVTKSSQTMILRTMVRFRDVR